eukprot:9486364-Pyramimonas_sp.AAC.1
MGRRTEDARAPSIWQARPTNPPRLQGTAWNINLSVLSWCSKFCLAVEHKVGWNITTPTTHEPPVGHQGGSQKSRQTATWHH